MKTKFSKILALLLCALMIFSSVSVFAENQIENMFDLPEVSEEEMSDISGITPDESEDVQICPEEDTLDVHEAENNDFDVSEEKSTIYISDPSQLSALGGQTVTDDIELLNDIDMADTEMEPIESFSGNFKGNGYKIKNLTIEKEFTGYNSDYDGAALIRTITGNSEITGVIFENPSVTLKSSASFKGAAVVAASAKGVNVKISNCAVVGGSVVTKSSSSSFAGSFVGAITNEGTEGAFLTISDSFSSADVKFEKESREGTHYIGGFLGFLMNSSFASENCVMFGDVSASSSYNMGNAGGFIGNINGSNSGKSISFENSLFTGTVSGSNKYGFAYSGRYAYPEISVLGSCCYDNEKNKSQSSWSPFEVFSSKAKVTGKVNGIKTADFALLDMGETFKISEGYPYPAWFVKESETHKIEITVNPKDASVSLTDENGTEVSLEKNDNVYSADVESGKYYLTVSPKDDEYEEEKREINIGNIDEIISISLKAKTYDVSFNVNPKTADVALYEGNEKGENALKPNDNGVYSVKKGDYYYEISDFGYVSKSGVISVSENKTYEITLEKAKTYKVEFSIYPKNADAKITLTRADGDKREFSGENNVFCLPEGSYDYKVSADSFKTKSASIYVSEDKNIFVKLSDGESWDGTSSQSLSGEGTKESPYVIKSGADLAFFASKVNEGDASYVSANYILQSDIDLSYNVWTPIGRTSAVPFKGTFDGNGHKITGINVSDAEKSVYAYYGLFGCLYDANVKNLSIGGEIYCTESSANVGSLAGSAVGNTTIENCFSSAVISSYAGAPTGGFVGFARKSDDIGYTWVDNAVLFKNCLFGGSIYMSGEDENMFSQGAAGGILGYSKNCSQFLNCANTGKITGSFNAAGICGDVGSAQGDNSHPYVKNCYNAGYVSGNAKTFPIYGGRLSESYVINCYAIGGNGKNDYVAEKDGEYLKSEEFLTALADEETTWIKNENENNGYPYPEGVKPLEFSSELYDETQKYKDVFYISASSLEGDVFKLIKDGFAENENILVSCVQTDGESYIERLSDGRIKLKKINDTETAVAENVTLLFTDESGRMRKGVKVILAPDEGARENLLNKLASIYASKTLPDEWVVFDMAAYENLKKDGENVPKLSDDAKQNYINVAIDSLDKSYTLATDRAKAEVIMASIGVDTTKLYPVNSDKSINNANLLKNENFANSYSAALWALLADMQGNVDFSKPQIQNLVKILLDNQNEDGLFSYRYGTETYTDVDSTGWAIAALSRFYLNKKDTYGVKDDAKLFIDKAVLGLSNALNKNASYGNISSDSMVITGLVSIGIDVFSDERFVKNGCSLGDAPMLYVNSDKNGFVSAYVSGSDGEKYAALATEQGFRGLVALAAFEKGNKKPYNIYAFTTQNEDGTESVPKRNPTRANGKGNVEVPKDIPDSADDIKVSYEIKALKNTWASGENYNIKKGSTVYHLIKEIAEAKGIETAGLEKGYIKSMTYNGETLGEFTNGDASGWLYYVNGELPDVGICDYVLKDGDTLKLLYTADYTKEPGVKGGMTSGTNSGKDNTKDDTKDDETKNDETNTSWKNPFGDVSEKDWYYNDVKNICTLGLMKGMSDNEFLPGAKLSRAMFVTMLYRLENEPEAKTAVFTDVDENAWYAKAASWASENGIVSGITDDTFAPDEDITREQMAAIIYRYAKYKGLDLSVGENTNILSYEDYNDIFEYALSAICYVSGSGIMLGKTDKTINPKDTATRAEAAAVTVRFVNLLTAK